MKQAFVLFLAVTNVLFCMGSFQANVSGQDAPAESSKPGAPRIIYTSVRVVAYQLRRLSNQQLVLVPRGASDPKYVPVYEALLSRPVATVPTDRYRPDTPRLSACTVLSLIQARFPSFPLLSRTTDE